MMLPSYMGEIVLTNIFQVYKNKLLRLFENESYDFFLEI